MDTYGCDGCGNQFNWDDIFWFTSSIGFCEKCNNRLHKRVPQDILDYCYEEVSCGNNELADFIIRMSNEKVY